MPQRPESASTPVLQGVDPRVGQTLGDYRFVRVLGAGGMGTVYEGLQLRQQRRCAIKVLLSEIAKDPVYLERFKREAEVTARLKQRHITELYDHGTLPDGSLFMAMEFLEGEDLADRIKRTGPLPPRQFVSILEGVAQALTAAHRIGVIHRDIKPANIFLARQPDGSELAKLLDFGAAKKKNATANLTAVGQVLGSMQYVSPEQARGQELDYRTDLFSLAIVSFESLTGRSPFEARSPTDVLFRIVQSPHTPIRQYRPELPEALDGVLGKALAKRREDRFDGVMEFFEAAATVLEPDFRRRTGFSTRSSAPPPSEPPRLSRSAAPARPAGTSGPNASPMAPIALPPPLLEGVILESKAPPPPPTVARPRTVDPTSQLTVSPTRWIHALTERRMLTAEQAQRAMGWAEQDPTTVVDQLVSEGFVEEKSLLRFIAGSSGCKYISGDTLARYKTPAAAIARLTVQNCRMWMVVPVEYTPSKDLLTVALLEPSEELLERVRRAARVERIQGIVALRSSIEAAQRRLYPPEPEPEPAPSPFEPTAPLTSAVAGVRDPEFDTLPPARAVRAPAVEERPNTDPAVAAAPPEPTPGVLPIPTNSTPQRPKSDEAVLAVLEQAKLLDAAGARKVRSWQAENGGSFGDAALRLEVVKELDFLRTFADLHSARFVKASQVTKVKFSEELLERLPVRDAESMQALPFSRNPNSAETHVIAAVPPTPGLETRIKQATDAKTVILYLAPPGVVAAAIRRWYYGDTSAFDDISSNGAGLAPRLPKPDPAEPESAEETAEPTRVGVAFPVESTPAGPMASAPAPVPPPPEEPPPGLTDPRREAAPAAADDEPVAPEPEQRTVQIQMPRRQEEESRAPARGEGPVALMRALHAQVDLAAGFELLVEHLGLESASWAPVEGSAPLLLGKRAASNMPPPMPLIARVIESGTPLIVLDAQREPELVGEAFLAAHPMAGLIAVPAMGRDRLRGVLVVDTAEKPTPALQREVTSHAEVLALRLDELEERERNAAPRAAPFEAVGPVARFVPSAMRSRAAMGEFGDMASGFPLEGSVLFAKIEGVADLANRLSPAEAVAELNRVWSLLADVLLERGAALERVKGESLVALWSPSFESELDADLAYDAALDLLEACAAVELGGRPLSLRVALHAGAMVLGRVGPHGTGDLALIGQPPRLASRLVGLAKPGQLVATQAFVQRMAPRDGLHPIPLQMIEGYGPSTMAVVLGSPASEELSLS